MTSTLSSLATVSNELANAVEQASASVVTVDARRRHPATGFVWSEDGLIVTANHVVERDEEIEVGLPDGRRIAVTLVGRDPGSDIALLRAEASGLTPLAHTPAEPRVGHLSLAIGRPGPSGPMASLGVISAVGGPMHFRGGSSLERYIRADVAMLPGFSGGPLVDAAGDLIGLNSSTLGNAGQLTVPVSVIGNSVTTLLQHGRVRRGYLGIGAQSVHLPETLINELGTRQHHGLLVVSVEGGGPAEAAGVLLGDILVAVDGQVVGHVEQLQDLLSGDRVGKSVSVRIVRGGEPRDFTVTVGERQPPAE